MCGTRRSVRGALCQHVTPAFSSVTPPRSRHLAPSAFLSSHPPPSASLHPLAVTVTLSPLSAAVNGAEARAYNQSLPSGATPEYDDVSMERALAGLTPFEWHTCI